MTRAVAGIAAVGILAALPAAASAKQYQAYAGNPKPASQPGTELNQFYPKKLRIRVGDTVRYSSLGFHNVSVLPKGASPAPLAAPDASGAKYEGINDPTGQPFFYNGLPKFTYNADLFTQAGNANVTKGETGENSGILLPSQDGPGRATLKFSVKGTTKVLCLIHPGMQQKVTVLGKKAKGADKTGKVAARAIKESNKGFRDADKAAAGKVPANTVYAGVERKQATKLAFYPANQTVAAGQAITFVNKSPSEVHNMTFVGAGAPPSAAAFAEQHQRATDLLPAFPGGNQLMPDFVYGSEPATAPGTWTYSGDEYGIGYLNTPLMDDAPGDPPAGLPGQETIVFSKPGTYAYYCAIHGANMAGTVTVQ